MPATWPWPSSGGAPTPPRTPSGSSSAAGEASRPLPQKSRMLRWRGPSDRWQSSTPRQDPSLRFHGTSKTRSSMTSTPRTPICRFFALQYCTSKRSRVKLYSSPHND